MSTSDKTPPAAETAKTESAALALAAKQAGTLQPVQVEASELHFLPGNRPSGNALIPVNHIFMKRPVASNDPFAPAGLQVSAMVMNRPVAPNDSLQSAGLKVVHMFMNRPVAANDPTDVEGLPIQAVVMNRPVAPNESRGVSYLMGFLD
ncbi:MAG: hypothetical protein IGQ88_11305 [Gloeomargaritaceae cyanobacterium C42_A2020_066]|nr:hypothetical protein [Gloeomargaritaceae cyanobacterium C42_A2020_066]